MKIPPFIFSIFSIFALSPGLLLAQSVNQLTPVWERSYGDRLLSSRDEVSYVFSDAQKNLILVGKVERDSTYGDIMVQKISTDGQLVWQFRFSSDKAENYDFLQTALLSAAGELYILGNSFDWGGFTGYGFLLKISPDGQLLWHKDFTTIIPNLFMGLNGHMFLDSGGDLQVAYLVYAFDDDAPFWFFRFAPDGTLIENFSRNGFFEQNGEVFNPIYLTNDTADNFTFLMQGDVTGPMPGGWLRKINTGLDTIIVADQQYFSESDSNQLKASLWQFFKTAPDGTIYAAYNNASQFFLLKLPSGGGPARIFSSGQAEHQQFKDIVVTDSSVILTGAYRPDSQSPFRVFVTEMDEEMNLIQNIHWANGEPNTVPRHIHQAASGNLYIKTDQLDSGISTLASVNPQLLPEWEFSLAPGVGFRFADVGLVEGANGQISLAGFRYAPIYPQELLTSKRDFQIISFDGATGSSLWAYQFSETGISGIMADQLGLDREGNPIVFVQEKEGLDFPNANLYGPIKMTLRKYDKDGALAWILPMNYSLYHLYYDLNNNLLLHVYDGQNNRIIKFSPDGEELAQVVLGDYFHNVYVDQQNRIHVQFDNRIVTLDENLSLLNQYYVPGKALSIFELPNDPSIYVYADTVDDFNVDFFLFKNGVQQWVQEVDIENNYQSGIADVCLNKQNGSLFVSSVGISGNPRRLHRFTLEGGYQFVSLNGSDDQQTLGILPSGDVWVFWKTEATLFSPELAEIKTVVALGGGALVRNGYLFKTEAGKVTIFEGQGDSLAQLSDPHFEEVLVDSDFNLYTVYTFGNSIFAVTKLYWARGALAKFNLRDYVNFPVGSEEPGQTVPESGRSFFWHNNPVVENLNIRMTASAQTPERITLFDAGGKNLKNFPWPAGEIEISVPMLGLPPGIYFASVAGKKSLIATLKVVKSE